MLRHHSELGLGAFYRRVNTSDTQNVERAFPGDVCCIITTSAFGEGVNISDIRQVILSPPFGRVAFNQMSGRTSDAI